VIDLLPTSGGLAPVLPAGTTVLDFVRYHQNLKGTKIGCREGDCGACTILVGELNGEDIKYRSMTSCLMPLANAAGKHIVTVEGINPENGNLTAVQQAMVEKSGTEGGAAGNGRRERHAVRILHRRVRHVTYWFLHRRNRENPRNGRFRH